MNPHTDSTPGGETPGYDSEISRRPVYVTGVVLLGTALLAFVVIWAFQSATAAFLSSRPIAAATFAADAASLSGYETSPEKWGVSAANVKAIDICPPSEASSAS